MSGEQGGAQHLREFWILPESHPGRPRACGGGLHAGAAAPPAKEGGKQSAGRLQSGEGRAAGKTVAWAGAVCWLGKRVSCLRGGFPNLDGAAQARVGLLPAHLPGWLNRIADSPAA